ncbi:hypothetical protein FIBSPDRAFT_961260 [Athelia psychrophila]|uniref:Uncharacterized protein n=1 Tax=Athelia psychrophila TaxID=1759441 RepID=A0A166BED5_9AGAM|nr:hypothetical protein FIBSPDRAFT_961260 [Fibularhizoctonia sp. CBS 109695]
MPPAPLRRSFSSPSVRATPYSSALAHLGAGPGRTQAHGHGNRRSSGAETTRRRVLADLEWWRVVDGQHDDQTAERGAEAVEGGQEQEQSAEAPASAPAPAVWVLDSDFERLPPTHQLETLSLSIAPPVTPRRLGRRHTSMFDSASPPSSLESTPESDESAHARFSTLDADWGLCDLPRFSLALPHPPLPLMRAHTFDFSALLNESADRFADIGVPSRLPDLFN